MMVLLACWPNAIKLPDSYAARNFFSSPLLRPIHTSTYNTNGYAATKASNASLMQQSDILHITDFRE